MTDWNGFKGAAKRLDDIDLPKLGAMLGVGEDEIHAFIDVETRGSGFDEQGRPRILFERHKFYAHLPAAKRAVGINAGLANKSAGGYGKESEQYGKLMRAVAIDERAALYACSWGLGQVMGFNHLAAGYDTVEEMILAFMEDEEAHLQAAVQFILTNKLDDELRAHNWAAFARGYNGADYKRNAYDAKLSAAYAKWAKIRDTAWSPEAAMSAAPTPTAAPPRPQKSGPPATPPVPPSERTAPAPQSHPTRDAVLVGRVPSPVSTDPIAAYNKVIGAIKGGGMGGGVFAAVLFLGYRLDLLPDALSEPDVQVAIGVVGTWLVTTITAAIKTYRAPRNAEAAP